jgi:hypothetical protein
MSYLYGDSTPSTLEVNFIEFLRDAVDCCVQVLLADQRIAEGAARVRALEASTAAEIARLQKVGALVPKAFEGTPVGEAESPTARCLAEIVRSAADIVRAASAAASSTLEAAVTRRDADAALEREVLVKALEALLVKHDLPEMTSDSDVALVAGGRYACRVLLTTPFGLDAMMATEVPAGHLLERVVRVDRLAERLDVQVPEIAGWLHKEVKLRTQHLEKHHLSAFARGPAGTKLALRLAPDGTGPGYDISFGGDDQPVRLVRLDEQHKREEPFEARESDVPQLVALRDKIAAAVAALERHRTKILEAKLEGEPLLGHPKPSLLVERLLAVLLPETREISARSQSPGELVLRRSLGGDRREEIFLSKRDLQAKLEPLDDRHRAMFDALLRDGESPTRLGPPPAPPPRTEPAAAAAGEGSGPSVFKRTLSPQPMSAVTATPAASPAVTATPAASPAVTATPAASPAVTATPAASPAGLGVPVPSPSRLPTPSYGVPTLAAHTPPPPPPPAASKPSSIAEALRATPPDDEAPTIKTTAPPDDAPTLKAVPTAEAPPRKTAPLELRAGEKRLAAALDHPPPTPRPAVAGEIGGTPEEKKRPESSGPITAT